MTPIRARRGKYIHCTADCRLTLCGRRCSGWVLGTERWPNVPAQEACPLCVEASTTN